MIALALLGSMLLGAQELSIPDIGRERITVGSRDKALKARRGMRTAKAPAVNLSGSGTQADPYLIKTRADLEALATAVNTDNSFGYETTSGRKVSRSFLGMYFRLENDIDMNITKFTPIGQDNTHYFAGHFDGNGHKISRLVVSTNDSGYAGLFGVVDAEGTVKNLTIADSDISCGGSMAAAVAAFAYGTVENCHVSNTYVTNTGQGAGAVCGVVNNLIRCTATKCVITASGRGMAGGLAAEVDNNMTSCSATEMSITSSHEDAEIITTVGGLAATMAYGTASDCYFQGTIHADVNENSYFAGGIAGAVQFATLERCFAVVDIRQFSPQGVTGGLAGNLRGTVNNCFTTGNVANRQSMLTGGLVGVLRIWKENDVPKSCVLTNSYSTTTVTCNMQGYDPTFWSRELFGGEEQGSEAVFANLMFDSQMFTLGSQKWSSDTQSMTAGGLDGFDQQVWLMTPGYYPVLRSMANTPASQLASCAIHLPTGSSTARIYAGGNTSTQGDAQFLFVNNGALGTQGHGGVFANGALQLTDFANDTICLKNGQMEVRRAVLCFPQAFKGEGTQASPYLLSTAKDLEDLSRATSIGHENYKGQWFVMTNDIDMTGSTRFVAISSQLGNTSVQFEGVFDGQDHAIHNLKINAVAFEGSPVNGLVTLADNGNRAYQGLIGRLGQVGVLRNVTIAADCSFVFYNYSAPLVAFCGGLVENCRNYADVLGYGTAIGGVAGYCGTGSDIRNCYNAGNITAGNRNAGGITGYANYYITNCVNTGDVRVIPLRTDIPAGHKDLINAGGVAGTVSTAVITNVVNSGTIYASTGMAGGICGALPKHLLGSLTNDLIGAVNYGMVYSGSILDKGPVAGQGGTQGSLQAIYYDRQLDAMEPLGGESPQGITGLSSKELTNGTPLAGLSTDVWDFRAGQYPTLKAFVAEPKVADTRAIVVTMADTDNRENLTANATLAAPQGGTWALSKGTAFKLNGNTLTVPAKVEQVELDTLTLTTPLLTKAIVIRMKPAMPVAGSGTQTDPYRIATPADWNAIADYITATRYDMAGMFTKITADLDFANTLMKAWAVDGTTKFEGTLDGAGHTLKNVVLVDSISYFGPIGQAGEQSAILSLTIEGTVTLNLYKSSKYVGGLVGRFGGVMRQCVNRATVTGPEATSSYAGGLVGLADQGAVFEDCANRGTVMARGYYAGGIAAENMVGVTYLRCVNEGTVGTAWTEKSASYFGGIVARTRPASTFVDCHNRATLATSPVYHSNVAGLFADLNGVKEQSAVVVNNCSNTADLKGKNLVGGLIGSTSSTAGSAMLTITNSFNTGNILSTPASGTTSSPCAGLIAKYPAGMTMRNCYNTGNITSKNGYTGGLLGTYSSSASIYLPINVVNCHNEGDVTGTSSGYAGGIVGGAGHYFTLDSCYNEGNVSCQGMYVGGLVGWLSGTGAESYVQNSYNLGTVTTAANRAGGLVGYSNNKGAFIRNCWNAGDVSTTNERGGLTTTGTSQSGFGIGGLAGAYAGRVITSYNLGSVKGPSRVGGIIGQPAKGTTMLLSCYNAGHLIADIDTCGNIIGTNTANAAMWNTGNICDKCYYVAGENPLPNDLQGTSKTLEEMCSLVIDRKYYNNTDAYTLPMLKGLETDAARLHAAVPVFRQGNSINQVTQNFYVGLPQGVTWSSDVPALNIDNVNNKLWFSEEGYIGKLNLTAHCGKYSKTYVLTVNCPAGLEDLTDDSATVVSEQWYRIDGTQVTAPATADGSLYIVVRRYSDGTTRTVRLLNR